MNIKISFFILLFSISSVHAHEVAVDEHAPFVPIPDYIPNISGASAEASLDSLKKLLAILDDKTKTRFMFTLDSPERQIWSNLPPHLVKRSGIAIDELSDPQRIAFFNFLSSSLSQQGYEKVAHIIAAEAFLDKDTQTSNSRYNPANYWFSIYGEPSMNGNWGWQIDGHHLAMNISISDGVTSSMSPSFIGTEPSVFTINGKKYSDFISMHQSGTNIYASLTKDQKKLATLQQAPSDVLTGANKDGVIPTLEGIKGSKLSNEQKQLLLKSIRQWVQLQANENANKRMKEIEANIDNIRFAWVEKKQGTDTYFRIQGPTLIIELLLKAIPKNAPKGSEHYHTMYRNQTLEYGIKNK